MTLQRPCSRLCLMILFCCVQVPENICIIGVNYNGIVNLRRLAIAAQLHKMCSTSSCLSEAGVK